MHNLSIISIIEPFANNSHINCCKLQLNIDKAYYNQNGAIWIFWTNDMDCKILDTDDQQILVI